MLLREIKSIFHLELKDLYPKEEIDSFYYMLIEHFFGFQRFVLTIDPSLVISKEKEKNMFAALAELKQERPIQYIMGKTHFMDMDFLVNENVLIPRPETEELVRWILDDYPGMAQKFESEGVIDASSKVRILDIGTGSGCIAISLAKNMKKVEVYAIDISNEALKIAKGNSELNDVNIGLAHMNIMNPPSLDMKYDIIVSNPPYVRELEKKDMQNNVKNYEPGIALFVPDYDPLLFYKAIVEFAKAHLKRNGLLFLEINQYLGKKTIKLLKDNNFSEIELRKDMFGHDRMMKAFYK